MNCDKTNGNTSKNHSNCEWSSIYGIPKFGELATHKRLKLDG